MISKRILRSNFIVDSFILEIILICNCAINAQWTHVNLGPTDGKVNSIAVNDSIVITGTLSGINRSTDYGNTWSGINGYLTLCFAMDDSNIFAGLGSGIISSSDDGITWVSPDTNMRYYVTSLAVKGNIIFAGTSQDGIIYQYGKYTCIIV